MTLISINTPAPDFSLLNTKEKEVSLSDFKDKKNVILVLNRGFM